MSRRDFRTLGSLVAEMRKVISDENTIVQYRTLKRVDAYGSFGGGKIVIHIGRGVTGRIEAAVHELSHIMLDPRFDGLGMSIEEPMIVGLEKAIVKHIFKSDKQIRWWLDRIREKLPDAHKEDG